MIPVMQTRTGQNPEASGNCFSACVASILECTLDDLPDEAKIVQEIKQEVGVEKWQEWPDRFKLGKSLAKALGAARKQQYGMRLLHARSQGAVRRRPSR